MTAPDLAALLRGDIFVVAAHPDDETIGMGALLTPRATVLHVTDGAPQDGHDAVAHGFSSLADYAAARRREALAALAVAGVERALTLDMPDQAAALHLASLARRITIVIAEARPGLVVTHAYEGGHPDHDAVAFAVRAALRLLPTPPPLAEMTGYHAGPDGIVVGAFLPSDAPHVAFPLSPEARAAKLRMLDCFATQRAVLAAFPLHDEVLRLAPPANFARAPHAGTLFYERFPWGMDGGRFRALAAAALDDLGLPRCR